jgi:hypothetical protein
MKHPLFRIIFDATAATKTASLIRIMNRPIVQGQCPSLLTVSHVGRQYQVLQGRFSRRAIRSSTLRTGFCVLGHQPESQPEGSEAPGAGRRQSMGCSTSHRSLALFKRVMNCVHAIASLACKDDYTN